MILLLANWAEANSEAEITVPRGGCQIDLLASLAREQIALSEAKDLSDYANRQIRLDTNWAFT
jgi:hypothetical protein